MLRFVSVFVISTVVDGFINKEIKAWLYEVSIRTKLLQPVYDLINRGNKFMY